MYMKYIFCYIKKNPFTNGLTNSVFIMVQNTCKRKKVFYVFMSGLIFLRICILSLTAFVLADIIILYFICYVMSHLYHVYIVNMI